MSDDLSPLEPNELDELLSADLDGELAAAARDHGSDVETLRARIAATPEAGTRRAELAAARELLAEVPEMDELVAVRLRAKAVGVASDQQVRKDDARRRRRSRVVMSTAGIAAAILLVITAVAAGHAHHGGTSSASSASPLTGGATTPSAGVPRIPALATGETALGSYRNAQTLGSVAVRVANATAAEKQQRAQDSTRYAAAPPRAPLAQPQPRPTTTAKAANSPIKGAANSGDNDQSPGNSAAVAGIGSSSVARSRGGTQPVRCAAPASPTPGDQLVLRANATLAGEPVTVFVFAGHGDHTVVIVSATCTLLNVQNLS